MTARDLDRRTIASVRWRIAFTIDEQAILTCDAEPHEFNKALAALCREANRIRAEEREK